VSLGLFVWSIVLIWKLLVQLRLRRLLAVLGIGYVVIVLVAALVGDTSIPIYRAVWLATRQLAVSVGQGVYQVGRVLWRTPEEFRFAYTGRRRPLLLPGIDESNTLYLTPIPAGDVTQLDLVTIPTAMSTRLPERQEDSQIGIPNLSGTKVSTDPEPVTPTVVSTGTPRPASVQSTVSSLQSPDCPDLQARLTMPRVNEVIRDQIQVEGSANIENLEYYKFEFMRQDGEAEGEWHWVESFEDPVEDGVLGIWHVSHLPEGIYLFRLTVVNVQGNYPFAPCEVQVQIRH
jgi:hypothetical protein